MKKRFWILALCFLLYGCANTKIENDANTLEIDEKDLQGFSVPVKEGEIISHDEIGCLMPEDSVESNSETIMQIEVTPTPSISVTPEIIEDEPLTAVSPEPELTPSALPTPNSSNIPKVSPEPEMLPFVPILQR